jgi:sec-independent protein translocase protein TatC
MTESPGEETFISHLIELRDRLVKASIGIAIVCAALMLWPGPAADLRLHRPADDRLAAGRREDDRHRRHFAVPGADESDAAAGLHLALPWVFYQLWAFIAPGLYAHEKKLVLPLVISSSLLFMAGVAFCYFFVFGRVFNFIGEFAPTSIAVTPDIENYLDFVMSMCLAFGATFEVPVVVVILVRMGIVRWPSSRKCGRMRWVGAFVIAAIVTPPDVVSQLSLAIPMCILFELGLLSRRCSSKPRRRLKSRSDVRAYPAHGGVQRVDEHQRLRRRRHTP